MLCNIVITRATDYQYFQTVVNENWSTSQVDEQGTIISSEGEVKDKLWESNWWDKGEWENGGGWGNQGTEDCVDDGKMCWWSCCNWIKLNTCFPIVWDCIKTRNWTWTTPINAFPRMMSALTKIAMSLVLVACFIAIIVAWIMRAWAWDDSSKRTEAKWLITKVAITILLLWFSGAILRLINPNFFG